MKVVLTGSTGMVGEGVLLVCLESPVVTEVLLVNRRPLGLKHGKLKELILKDFFEIKNHKETLKSYDACFFCAGVSSVGETEESFIKKTYDFVVPFAKALSEFNSKMTFIYVSGRQTDSTEQGKVMWARVKGRTENALLELPFKAIYHFRPGFMQPLDGQKNVRFIFHAINALAPIWYFVTPNWICQMQDVGQAMLNCVTKGYRQSILEVEDIKKQAKL